MFLNEFEHNMDSKGRVSIPSSFRDELGEVVYVAPGSGKYLTIYKKEDFEVVSKQIQSFPRSSKSLSLFKRKFNMLSSECQVDKMGRIIFTPNQRSHASLEKEVIFIGSVDKIEVWSRKELDSIFDEEIDYKEVEKQLDYRDFNL